jgi:hypothetical protein
MAVLRKVFDNIRRTRRIWIGTLLVILVMAAVGLTDRWLAFKEIDQSARGSLVNQVRLIENHIGEHIRSINTVLDQILIETTHDGICDQTQVERFGRQYPEFRSVSVIDADGTIRCASLRELIGQDRSTDRHFLAEKARPTKGALNVDPPFMAQSGIPIMLFHKSVSDANSQLRMIVQLGVDLHTYDTLLDSLREKNQGIFLAHEGGVMLSRLPDPDRNRLRDASKAKSVFSVHRESGQALTVVRSIVAADQVDRYVAIADVVPKHINPAPNGHLIVGLSERVDRIFPYWWQQNLMLLSVWWLASMVLLVMAFKLARSQLQTEDESRVPSNLQRRKSEQS